jgi:AbrB family looped-hinge helix DNA binding protein
VTSKGQVTVPKAVRDALGIKDGDQVVFRLDGNRAVLARTPDFLAIAGTIDVPPAKRNVAWDDVVRRTRSSRGARTPLTAFADTNVLVRHLTGDSPDKARRPTAYLTREPTLLLTDLIAAETVYVLESFYEAPRAKVADAMRSLIAFKSIVCVDTALLLRAVEVYETERIDFAEAYLVACAETTGVGKVASFDRSIDRVTTVERIEPASPRPRS